MSIAMVNGNGRLVEHSEAFEAFVENIRYKVEKLIGGESTIKIHDVRKNNNRILTGLTVIQDDTNVSPTIYLNNYYKSYEEGAATLPDVVHDVVDTYRKNKVNQTVDMRYFLNYDSVRPKVVYKLVNTEKNRELLEDIPHMDFLDLSIVFQCMVTQEEFGTASILIHNVHLKLWDVTVEDLFKAAKENTPELLEYQVKSMTDVLCEIMEAENPDGFDYDECVAEFSDSIPMYVLSNKSRVEGAACMLYPNLLRDYAEAINSSYFIIPSSIHEGVTRWPSDKQSGPTVHTGTATTYLPRGGMTG